MKLIVITHVPHKNAGNGSFAAYGPYIKEMNLWYQHVDEVFVVAPFSPSAPDKIDITCNHKIQLIPVKEIDLTSFSKLVKSLFRLPGIFYTIFKAMKNGDHIHLRCPGNIGLVGCLAQILFPSKKKSAKYAGNWDPFSQQPWSYKLQRWMLNNEWFTHNMQVMVYGNWPDSSQKNVCPFFTASYDESMKLPLTDRTIDGPIKLLFVGALIDGKQPLLSVQIAEKMHLAGSSVRLDVFGNGALAQALGEYVANHDLTNVVILHGNQPASTLIEAYRDAHFLIFLSKSEGWPKAVAESMWWGCIPITTAVSCVPEMLGNESRGALIHPNPDNAVLAIQKYLSDQQLFRETSQKASDWARQFTLEKMDLAIQQLLMVKTQ